MRLTVMQQKFVEAFTGNATEAARIAGYKKPTEQGYENLRKPHIKDAIEAREAGPRKLRIATREERQNFWTKIMLNPEERTTDRLKASELLGKSNADFSEKHIHQGDSRPTIHIERTIVTRELVD